MFHLGISLSEKFDKMVEIIKIIGSGEKGVEP